MYRAISVCDTVCDQLQESDRRTSVHTSRSTPDTPKRNSSFSCARKIFRSSVCSAVPPPNDRLLGKNCIKNTRSDDRPDRYELIQDNESNSPKSWAASHAALPHLLPHLHHPLFIYLSSMNSNKNQNHSKRGGKQRAVVAVTPMSWNTILTPKMLLNNSSYTSHSRNQLS